MSKTKKAAAAATANWFTSIMGLLTLASGLAPVWAPPNVASKVQQTTAVFTAIGLAAAQDGKRKDEAGK